MVLLAFDTLDLEQIAKSGQCFRMTRLAPGVFRMPVGSVVVEARQVDAAHAAFHADMPDEDLRALLSSYLDAEGDYLAALSAIDPLDRYLTSAAAFGRGIRILRQPLWETLASFILSQNNNIPRIRSLITRLCGGESRPFPPACEVARLGEQALRSMGMGYRAGYLFRAAQRFTPAEEALLCSMPYPEARAHLMTYPGIGEKVADCICLFGLGFKEPFLWMYGSGVSLPSTIRRDFPFCTAPTQGFTSSTCLPMSVFWRSRRTNAVPAACRRPAMNKHRPRHARLTGAKQTK